MEKRVLGTIKVVDKKVIRRRRRMSSLFTVYIIPAVCLVAAGCLGIYICGLKTDIKTANTQVKEANERIVLLESQIRLTTESAINLQNSVVDADQTVSELETEIEILTDAYNSLKAELDETTVTPVVVDRHTDLKVVTTMTTSRMNHIIDEWNKRQGGDVRFVGHGQAFITASKITGLDPVYLLAHSAQESGFGTTRIAREKNNFMGIGAYDASPYESSFVMGDGIDQGIINGAVWIADNYYKEGQTSLHSMIYGKKEYSTSKDDWINSIVWLWNKSYTL